MTNPNDQIRSATRPWPTQVGSFIGHGCLVIGHFLPAVAVANFPAVTENGLTRDRRLQCEEWIAGGKPASGPAPRVDGFRAGPRPEAVRLRLLAVRLAE